MLASKDTDDAEIKAATDQFLKDIHSGKIKPGQVHQAYYDAVSKKLLNGVSDGLGGNTFGADDYKNTLKAFLDQNVYAFSGARSLYMLQQYNSFLTDKNGNVLSESAFISKVADITDIDNLQHLKVERNDTITKAQAAEKWQGLKSFQALEYHTTKGENVCPICGGLDGLKLATNDPRWKIIYIPNHYGCKCNIVPASTNATLTPDDRANSLVKNAKIPPYFRRNVGIEKLIFADDHPYIESIGTGKLRELDAEKTYGLQSVEKIYDKGDLASYKPLADKEAANKWWSENAGSLRGSFDMKSIDGLTVNFDNGFRNHVFEQNKDDRFLFVDQVKALLESPDEVWSNRTSDKLMNIYIKYYKDAPMALLVDVDNNVRASTIFELKKGKKINFDGIANMRKGALKYRSH